MKSSIELYGYCELEQEKNFIIDNQETLIDYIDSLDMFYSDDNFQYIKHDLEIVIKINNSQVDLTNNLINYCRIKNDEDEYPVYYFVTKIQAGAENTNRIYLKMDTLTTFFTQGRMTLNDKTKVLRQHKDRFFQNASGRLQRKVDNISEGVQPIQFKLTESKIEDDNANQSLDWFLMYRTQKQLSPDDISNPLNCYLVPSKELSVGSSGLNQVTFEASEFNTGYQYMTSNLNNDNNGEIVLDVVPSGTITLKFGTIQRGFNYPTTAITFKYTTNGLDVVVLRADNNGAILESTGYQAATITFKRPFNNIFKLSNITQSNNINGYYYQQLTAEEVLLGTSTLNPLISINDVDRTDTRIMKIIKLPYSPSNFVISANAFNYNLDEWEYNKEGMLQLKDLSTEFEHRVKVINIPNLYISRPNTNNQSARLPLYESKLYSSDYYTYKIGYDSFTKAIDYERLLEGASTITFYYKMTNTFNSKMLFYLRLDEYKSIEDYELYLPLARNNEISIYSNDFLNYIRTGYNYDKKTLERQSINNIISTAGGVVGGIASAVAGGPIGWATAITIGVSTLTRLVTSINQQVQNEQTLESKLKQLSLQSSSVSGSDDVDLMSYYTGNRAVVMTYSVSEEMKKALYDLFYYCGYARNFNEKVDIYSRKNFNFLQCEAVWDKYAYIPNDWVEDMNQRLLAGVTIFHYNNGFDFSQEYENWEVWL